MFYFLFFFLNNISHYVFELHGSNNSEQDRRIRHLSRANYVKICIIEERTLFCSEYFFGKLIVRDDVKSSGHVIHCFLLSCYEGYGTRFVFMLCDTPSINNHLIYLSFDVY